MQTGEIFKSRYQFTFYVSWTTVFSPPLPCSRVPKSSSELDDDGCSDDESSASRHLSSSPLFLPVMIPFVASLPILAGDRTLLNFWKGLTDRRCARNWPHPLSTQSTEQARDKTQRMPMEKKTIRVDSHPPPPPHPTPPPPHWENCLRINSVFIHKLFQPSQA